MRPWILATIVAVSVILLSEILIRSLLKQDHDPFMGAGYSVALISVLRALIVVGAFLAAAVMSF